MNKRQLDADACRKLLSYDPETGQLRWRERSLDQFNGNRNTWSVWNSQRAGNVAGSLCGPNGRKQVSISGKTYQASRIAWLIKTGDWPKRNIDHINGDPSDNRWENLRDVSQSENAKNAKVGTRNKSGVLGVSRHGRKWYAHICKDGHRVFLGSRDSFFESVCLRKSAEARLGYHPNHGRAAVSMNTVLHGGGDE